MAIARTIAWKKRHPEKAKDSDRRQMLKKYGLTPGSYRSLLDKQNGGCAICAGACPTGRQLAVDHDHKTNKVRGLLCASCNTGLGRFRDDPSLIRAAANYLMTVTLT